MSLKFPVVLLFFSTLLGITPLLFSNEEAVQATVCPDKVVNQIDRRIYGQFLEHLYNAVNNGLWGDLVYNRSLEMAKNISSAESNWTNRGEYNFEEEAKRTGNVRYWNLDPAITEWRSGDARNSNKYVRFNGAGNMMQNNFYFVQGEEYEYSFWVRGDGNVIITPASEMADITFNKSENSFNLHSSEWQKFCGTFTVDQTTDRGEIRLTFNPDSEKSLDLDQISIMPKSWKENFDGMRPDLVQAIDAIHPPTMRWPGGCYASAYRWKSGIGPQDDRVSHPMEYRNDIDVNSFGTDEFITLCRRVNAEPIFVVNLGTKEWVDRTHCQDEKIDWYQDVCDWVEYCNGPADSLWGSKRAALGHPEPYNVQYWEIDNEVNPGTTSLEEYVKILKNLVPRMRAISPDIKIIVSGSWGPSGEDWDRGLIQEAGQYFNFLSTHRYDEPDQFAIAPWEIQRFFEKQTTLIQESIHPNIRLYHSEWNAQSIDWKNGLYAGGFLLAAERAGDIVAICSPCLFLRGIDGVDWNNSLINLDNKSWFPAPNYVVMKLWEENYAPYRVELTSSSPELNGNEPAINAVATTSVDGKTIHLKIVNTLDRDVTFQFDVLNRNIISQTAQTVTPSLTNQENSRDKLDQKNTLEKADNIKATSLPVDLVSGKVQTVLPSFSATVITLKTEKHN